MAKNLFKLILNTSLTLLGLWFTLSLVGRLGGEILWFQELDYLSVFLTRIETKFGLWLIISSLSFACLQGNLSLANRLKWGSKRTNIATKNSGIYKNSSRHNPEPNLPHSTLLKFSFLLPVILLLSLSIGIMLIYYGDLVLSVWKVNFSLPQGKLPVSFTVTNLPQIIALLSQQAWKFFAVGLVSILFVVQPKLFLQVIAVSLSLLFGAVLAGNWTKLLYFINAEKFNVTEPLFGKDIGFYIFKLPLWELLDFWLCGLLLYALISVALTYLLSGNSLSEGKFPGFSRPQLRHLYALGSAMMLALAARHWLEGYLLLFSSRGIVYGASYTDIRVQLPVEIISAIIAAGIGLLLLFKSITGFATKQNNKKVINTSLVIILVVCYLLVLLGQKIPSSMMQNLVVQPNELEKEKPYIERNIAFTKNAFGLDKIEAKTFDPEGKLNQTILKENHLTIDNIRLWDTKPLLQTNRQLQQIRLYYRFLNAAIDRYLLKIKPPNSDTIVTERQQIIIAGRELDYSAVPDTAKTWVNEHLVYTHGYGFTLSPVNRAGEGGLPYYFVKDISTSENKGDLRTSSELVRDTIPIGKPRIYYGELTDTYVMTSTKVKEFDFPSGQDNVYNVYDGSGGIKINSLGKRILFAKYLNDWRMLLTDNFTPDTKVLFRRNINNRIRAIAPFLYYDRDPYLVVADIDKSDRNESRNYLYWIVDAYTISDRYPYSDPGENQFNYIRNSVKVVIDAYNGNVSFYISDPEDPIVKTWSKTFPKLFKPLDAMPATLRSHLRYPEDLFSAQSERLLIYHMTDPQVFYNREDQWEIAKEIYGNESQPVQPYYLIMKLPEAEEEEFILLSPYTPKGRPNLIAWLAGRSDGKEYGKLLLYQFSKEKLIYGPDQIEALINQDPSISQRISLWNREGSRVLQGNLLIIPIENSLLYVEPLYLEAEKNSLPTLARVIVVYKNRIVMAGTLPQALDSIFAEKKG
jgi:hypothetical protein